MKVCKNMAVMAGMAAVLLGGSLFAQDAAATKSFKDKVVVEEPTKWWAANLSTGWDSLYMFRGVNVISHGAYGNNSNYGSGIYWTDLALTWNISKNDTFSVEGWQAFGTQNTTYKEFDFLTYYTHTFGDLSLTGGYTLYFLYPSGQQLYANELSVKAAYNFHLGSTTITPSLGYYFDLGPSFASGNGATEQCSSYLQARVDAAIPVYKDIVSLAPWTAFGVNFDYNARLESANQINFYNGVNNLEFGLAIPVKINSIITVSGYGAYSYAFYNLWGTTSPSTFYGGAKVNFAF